MVIHERNINAIGHKIRKVGQKYTFFGVTPCYFAWPFSPALYHPRNDPQTLVVNWVSTANTTLGKC